MKKELILVRHSEAEFGSGSRNDFERALTEQGMVLANRQGRLLYEAELKPDLMASSTATRAAETAKILASQIRYDQRKIQYEDLLYNISLGAMLNWLGRLDEKLQFVIMIGHNPVMSYLAEFILDETGFYMQPCDMIHIQMEIHSWMLIDKKCGTQVPINA